MRDWWTLLEEENEMSRKEKAGWYYKRYVEDRPNTAFVILLSGMIEC